MHIKDFIQVFDEEIDEVLKPVQRRIKKIFID